MSDTQIPLAQAHALQQQGRLAEAAAAYRKILTAEPRNAQALHLLGVTLARMGSPQDAVVCLAAAVDIEPRNPAMRINLANALTELGYHDQAVTHYQRAVVLKPDFAPAHRALGLALIRTGQLDAALASLTHAMRLVPGDARLYNDMGVICGRMGRRTEALRYFESATRSDHNYAEAHRNRGAVELALAKYEEALASLDRAIALQPRQPAIHNDRADALLALGRFPEALASYDRSIALGFRDATTFRNRGAALLELGRDAEALASLEYGLQLTPGSAPAHSLRAKVLIRLQRAQDALASLDVALGSSPSDFDSHFDRGVALSLLERHEESLASFDRALELNEGSAETLNNRGVELGQLSRPQEALESFAKALARKPDHFDSYTNAGNLRKGLGRFDEALRDFDSALRIAPADPMTLWSKALLKLTLGDLAAGWPMYEARFQLPHVRGAQRRFDVPRWTGAEPIEGKTILVHAEQGLGDTVQFCRYVSLLEARGAQVLLQVQPALAALLSSLKMRGRCFANEEPLRHFDLHCPLLSLPLAFRTELDTIPNGVPYLAVDPATVTSLRTRLDTLPGLKVGLNWQGNVDTEKQPWVRGRSFPLAFAAPLVRAPGVTWVSLQRGPGAEQRGQVEFGAQLAQLIDPLDLSAASVLETAALVKALDLVVTSDTFVAHLCGALGVPVWTVVQAVPDWRWLLERADNPWYPTMRLFRQGVPGEWTGVFERVAAEVELWCSSMLRHEHAD
jgi:tetratricopeptide (TPR) repeat protein